jgi:hypothetical protein
MKKNLVGSRDEMYFTAVEISEEFHGYTSYTLTWSSSALGWRYTPLLHLLLFNKMLEEETQDMPMHNVPEERKERELN